MSYSPRGGYDDRDTRDSWGRGSAAGGGAGPREDYSVPMDDPYGNPRRPRSPDDDRRKRRRSPSPIGSRGADTYIPSYHRDRSPPYRDRGRDPYAGGGGGGGYGAPPYSADRYDSRSYRGDFYDTAAGGQPGGYDRRQAPYNPPRSQLRPPLEVPYLVPFSYYRDWVRDEDHRLYDDKAKLEEAYKNYRSSYLYKAHQGLWTDIKEMAWCKEKYGIGEEEVNERKKLRERGRQGKMEAFVQAVKNGDLDSLSLDQKLPAAISSPPKKELKLEANEEAKINNPEATVKEEEEEQAKKEEGDSPVKMEEEAPATTATAQEEDKKVKTDNEGETEAENGDGKMEEDTTTADETKAKEAEGTADATTSTAEGANAGEEKKDVDEAQQNADGNNEEAAAKKGDDDSILIPAAPTTLFIKSLSPEISRSDLEAHCKQVEGYDYIALGEPNPLKKFHRIGWVVFKPDANMEQAVEKLCESKINNFILHMHLADQATYQRTRVTPNLFATPARIKQSLQQAKQIVSNMESAELPNADEDPSPRGSQTIEERLSILREKQVSELAEDDSAGPLAQSALEESLERKALDLYIQYLRSVFHTCFYCVCTSDFEEELTRRCVKHVRKQVAASKNAKDKEAAWIKNFDDKIQLLVNREGVEPLDYGGENYGDELTKLCKPNIQQEDEGKYRCKQCKKLFKAAPFVEKHILNKHSELIGDRLEQLKYFNNYVLDPGHIAPPLMDASAHSNQAGYPMNGNFYNSGVATTFGAFNQMFNPNFGGGAAYNMMGMPNQQFAPYGQQMFSPMNAGFNGGGYPAGGPQGYGAPPLSGGARALNDRIGDRAGGFGYGGGPDMRMNGGAPNKRLRRESGNQPPPPPRGAKMDPRAGRLHAYTDLDGPPASGGDSDMMLDY